MQKPCDLTQTYKLAFFAIVLIAVVVAVPAAAENVASSAPGGIVQRSCGDHQRCPWSIPPIESTGCCPKENGEVCHPAIQEFCNSEFELVCVDEASDLPTESPGVCRGRYNLTATSVGQHELTLEWPPFAPPEYRHEYGLLLRTDSFHRDSSRWELRECGDEPRCVVRRLDPDTTYLFKIFLWKDARAMKIGTMTETVVVQTESVDFCEDNREKRYQVGERFIYAQEDNCTCLASGEIQCSPLCPNGIPEVDEGCQIILGKECQFNITCNLEKGFEQSEEELCNRYPEGTELRIDCRICSCVGERLKCRYSEACSVTSPKPSCKHLKEIKIPGQCCPEWECKDVCEYENKSYSAGELFTSFVCGLCQCQPSGKVECLANCPPTEMVAPSPACPSPHIKRSGCCYTLHCFKEVSNLFSYVSNLDVLYTTPFSVTVSFKAEPACEINGRPSYCNYRLQFANTSSNQDSLEWENRVVHPVDMMEDGLKPIQLLTSNSAVVINGRAVVTLTGMYPSAEFYVVVTREEENRDDMTKIEDESVSVGHRSPVTKVVVKTRPLQNDTSCFYSGREVLHGEVVSQTCSQACQCLRGEIKCSSTCKEEKFIIASSLSCPQPRREQEKGECCPKWHCYPSVSGCRYKNAVLRTGQVISDGCQECVCKNSSLRCISLCPPIGSPPRAGCILTNETDHCCPQWSCPIETLSPLAVESSVWLKFEGICQHPFMKFQKDFAAAILNYITSLINCSNSEKSNDLCNSFDVRVISPSNSSAPENRVKRSSSEEQIAPLIAVVISVRRNFSSEKDTERVFKSCLHLQKILNTSFVIHLPNGYNYESHTGVKSRKPVYICQRGFSYKNQQCVLSQIDIMGSQWTQVELFPVDISPNAVTVQWSQINDNLQKKIKSLYLKFRPKKTMAWLTTKMLQPSRTSVTVLNLQPHTSYAAALVAITDHDEHKWILGDVSFDTVSLPRDLLSFSINLEKEYVSADCIILSWGHLSPEFWNELHNTSIHYSVSSSNQIHEQPIRRGKSLVVIEGLSSGTDYTFQLITQAINSSRLQVTTLPSEKDDPNVMIPVLTAVLVLAVLALVLLMLAWHCRRGQRKDHNFENKTFGMTLENNTGTGNNSNSSPS